MITLSYQGEPDLDVVEQTAEEALGGTHLTPQTGENEATGESTLKISLPASETVDTQQVTALLDGLAASNPCSSAFSLT